jgi:ribose transport system permease protein
MSSSRPLTTRAALSSAIGTVAGLLVALALMVGFFSWQSEYFFTSDTFVTIANDIPAVAVTAVGMTFVLIIAGIDLSVGSTMALAAAVAGIAMLQWHWSLLPATLLAMGVGVVVGAINGAVTVAWRLPSFIVTLGMLEMARGAAYVATDSRTQYIGGKIDWLGKPIVLGLSPQFFIAIAIVAVAQVVLTRTVFGRSLIGIGTNEEAMRLAGVDPRPLKVVVFALAGLLAGLGGVFLSSRLEHQPDGRARLGGEHLLRRAGDLGAGGRPGADRRQRADQTHHHGLRDHPGRGAGHAARTSEETGMTTPSLLPSLPPRGSSVRP